MAWEAGPFTVSSGAPARFFLSFRGYPGIQVIQARPIATRIGDLIVSAPGELGLSDLTFQWRPLGGGRDTYTYLVTVTYRGGGTPITFVFRGNEV